MFGHVLAGVYNSETEKIEITGEALIDTYSIPGEVACHIYPWQILEQEPEILEKIKAQVGEDVDYDQVKDQVFGCRCILFNGYEEGFPIILHQRALGLYKLKDGSRYLLLYQPKSLEEELEEVAYGEDVARRYDSFQQADLAAWIEDIRFCIDEKGHVNVELEKNRT